jgi:integrase
LISDQCTADKISPALGEIDLLILAGQTGLRATELTQLTIGDAHLGTGPHVSCLGKGRKQRTIPLTRTTPTSPSKNEPSRTAPLGTQPLPATRRHTRVPRKPVTMPDTHSRQRLPPTTRHPVSA